MRVRFADRLTDDGTVRCTGCSHEVVVRRGDAVPRCYCGGEAFEYAARATAAQTPRPVRPPPAERRDEPPPP